MFNENIKARDTTYDINFLTVSDFQEIYFDVYELVINGNKYIAEKVSDYKGMPVVTIPVTINGIAEDASFVLKKGAQEVLFNKKNTLTPSDILSTDTDFLDSLNEDSISEISNLYIDSEAINEELEKAKLSATVYAKAIKEQKIEEATQAIERKKKDAKKEIESYKKDLLEEFYGLTEDIRSSLHESNTAEQLVIRKNVSETLEILSEELDNRIEKASKGVNKFYDNKIKLIEESVLNITKNQRDNVIAIISESKQSLLDKINAITVPQSSVIVERDGISTLDLREVKKEIERKITAKFSAEMGSLKRYIELSSGGGSVAQQFAAGGTMNGNLTVTGTISASQYLGIVTSTGNEVLIGGNSAGTNMLIGTNDNFNLNLETAGTTKMTVTNTGNVGIGTTAPSTKLEIVTTGTTDGLKLKRADDDRTAWLVDEGTGSGALYLFNGSNSNTVFITGNGNSFISSGNVGIGTTNPQSKLEVYGATSTLTINTGDGSTTAGLRFAHRDSVYADSQIKAGIFAPAAGSFGLSTGLFFAFNNLTDNSNVSVSDSKLAILTNGNVGIGTTTPTANLQVNQSVNGMGTISVAAGGTIVTGSDTQFLNTFRVGDTITSAGQTLTISAISSNTSMTTSAAGAAITTQPYTLTGGTRLSVFGNGNVQIPNTLELNTLAFTINGVKPALTVYRSGSGGDGVSILCKRENGLEIGDLRFIGSATVPSFAINLRHNNAAQSDIASFNLMSSNKSSILFGTFNGVSSSTLSIFNTTAGVSNVGIILGNMTTAAGSNMDIQFYSYAGDPHAIIRGVYNGGTKVGALSFLTANGSTPVEALRITQAGNVGIGTATPGSNLTISGTDVSDSAQPGANVLRGNLTVQSSDAWAINKGGSIAFSGTITGTTQQQVFGGIAGRKENITDGNARGYLGLYVSGTGTYEKMRIDSNGNVGVGITNPLSKLQVIGNITVGSGNLGTTGIGLNVADGYNTVGFGAPGVWFMGIHGSTDNQSINITDANSSWPGTSRVTFLRSGNVGVGTTTPASKVTVTGGDVEITTVDTGVIFKTPDGTKRYRLTISNAGAPVFTLLS
jgi:hypothetical protein